jgi:hypothetical protein
MVYRTISPDLKQRALYMLLEEHQQTMCQMDSLYRAVQTLQQAQRSHDSLWEKTGFADEGWEMDQITTALGVHSTSIERWEHN